MRSRLPNKFLAFLILLTVSCIGASYLAVEWFNTGFWGWPYHSFRLRLVENKLEDTLLDIPQLDTLHLLGTRDVIISSHIQVPKKIQSKLREEGEPPCYYATRWFIFGTELTDQQVVNYFVDELVPEGWFLVELDGHGRLIRDDNESIYIDQASESNYFYSKIGFDYDQVKETYGELISIQVRYTWPKRAGC